MREIFAPFGAIDLVQIQRDGAGKSQGHAYVTCVCCVCSLFAFALCLLSLLFALCSPCSLLSALFALCLRLLLVCSLCSLLSLLSVCVCSLSVFARPVVRCGSVLGWEQRSRLMTAFLLLATFMQWRRTAIAWKETCKVLE